MLKSTALPKLRFREPTGLLTKHFDRLGPKVDKMFPLIDPSLDFTEALKKHTKWHDSEDTLFLTDGGIRR